MAVTKVHMKYNTAEGTFEVDSKVLRQMDIIEAPVTLPDMLVPDDTSTWNIEIQTSGQMSSPAWLEIWLKFKHCTYSAAFARVSISAEQKVPPEGFPPGNVSMRYEKDFTFVMNKTRVGRVLFNTGEGNALIIHAKMEMPDVTFKPPKAAAVDNAVGLRVDAEQAVCRGLGDLLDSGLFADVLLCAAGGEEVPAHRSILAARSDFFKGMFMFSGDWKESSTERVQLDIRLPVLKQLVR